MVIDLLITGSDDGFTAEVPSVNGCESWAHEEEDAINNAVGLLRFYLNLDETIEIKIDKARRSGKKTVYKLVFDKEVK